MRSARFPLGACVARSGTICALSAGGDDCRFNAAPLLVRHQGGDWGDLSPEAARENELSVREDFRIVSSYDVGGERVWIVTEDDRSSTCILLPEEY